MTESGEGFKQILVVDLEATCWKKKPPPGQQNEIIEIGVCRVDLETFEIEDARGLIVKPTRSQVSDFCTKLTSITPEMAEDGITFAAACDVLRNEYQSAALPWTSWGAYDLRMFRWQSESFAVPYPFSAHHIDLKGVYAALRNKGKRIGMARALKTLELSMEGRHHRGVDDAYNTARILLDMLKREGLDFMRKHMEENWSA